MIRRRRAVLPVLAALAALLVLGLSPGDGGATGARSAALRVMSFNLRYGTADDGPNAWPRRRELVKRTIGDFDPTVLGVQEALRFQLDELREAFPHLGEVGVGRDDGAEAGEYSAILYDRRRLERLSGGTFWLSDTPEVVASTSWGNQITRIVTWARFRNRESDRTFYVFNTHWDHESQHARERSAALMLERIAALHGDDPVLVTGDFNAGEENPAFRHLVGEGGAVGLHDTFRALHPDAADVGTFNGFDGDRTGEKIDAVLASSAWRVEEASIVRTAREGRYPSDHFPVTAIVSLPGE